MKIAVLALAALLTTTSAHARSCADLWYERNLIFAENGYCFTTRLGQTTFANIECWTDDPRLTAAERRRIAAIKREERARGCKVN